MNSGTIVKTITDELNYDALNLSEDNLWSVLLMTGYITKADTDEEGVINIDKIIYQSRWLAAEPPALLTATDRPGLESPSKHLTDPISGTQIAAK